MPTGDGRANAVLDAIYGSAHASGFPATVYVALYYASPDGTGGGTEADYDTYARVALTNNDTNFPDAVDREKVVALQIDFPTPGEDTDDFVAWAIHGHVTNDDIIHYEAFTDAVSAADGEPVYIPADTLVITIPDL